MRRGYPFLTPHPIAAGVRQGNIPAPLLYSAYTAVIPSRASTIITTCADKTAALIPTTPTSLQRNRRKVHQMKYWNQSEQMVRSRHHSLIPYLRYKWLTSRTQKTGPQNRQYGLFRRLLQPKSTLSKQTVSYKSAIRAIWTYGLELIIYLITPYPKYTLLRLLLQVRLLRNTIFLNLFFPLSFWPSATSYVFS